MNILSDFKKEFAQRYSDPNPSQNRFNRLPAFEFIVKELSQREDIFILETGTVRYAQDWMGTGCSTLLWDWLVQRKGGHVVSVDNNPDVIKICKPLVSDQVKLVESDSITYLRSFTSVKSYEVDLLYLDSFDWSTSRHAASCLHHIGELACIYERLKPGTLIAIDDCHSDKNGKHILVDKFFQEILNVKPLVSCHVRVYKKP